MTAVCINSNGFAATRWLGGVLSSLPGVRTWHGRRNLHAAEDDRSVSEFAADMLEAASRGPAVAIDCRWEIEELNFLARHGIRCAKVMRHPEDRIYSCFSWVVARFVKADIPEGLDDLTISGRRSFGRSFSTADALFLWATEHVTRYDRIMTNHYVSQGWSVWRMEDITASPETLARHLDQIMGRSLPRSPISAAFSGERHSYSSKPLPQRGENLRRQLMFDRLILKSFLSRPENHEVYQDLGYDPLASFR